VPLLVLVQTVEDGGDEEVQIQTGHECCSNDDDVGDDDDGDGNGDGNGDDDDDDDNGEKDDDNTMMISVILCITILKIVIMIMMMMMIPIMITLNLNDTTCVLLIPLLILFSNIFASLVSRPSRSTRKHFIISAPRI
jgi:hypothetical protein